VFLIGYLRNGLGLINVPAQILLIIIGLLLVVAVMVPNLQWNQKRALRHGELKKEGK
jgi:rhamnose transport system permease protein